MTQPSGLGPLAKSEPCVQPVTATFDLYALTHTNCLILIVVILRTRVVFGGDGYVTAYVLKQLDPVTDRYYAGDVAAETSKQPCGLGKAGIRLPSKDV
jgi:hypothetical protein